MANLEYANPWFLFLLVIIPILYLLRFVLGRKKKSKGISMPNIDAFPTTSFSFSVLGFVLFSLRMLALALIIIAFARPRIPLENIEFDGDSGVDIMLVLDVSGSMSEIDVAPSRMEVVKDVAIEFAQNRKHDRIGLLTYCGEALTKVPLTTDRNILVKEISKLYPNELGGGTAIGDGLATSINHLKDSKAKSKVAILLTDGENNDGTIDPILAAKIAESKDVKVYTIGFGATQQDASGGSFFPFAFRTSYLDEELLQDIANITGGKYFRAGDKQTLQKVYKEINALEKSEINKLDFHYYKEKYKPMVIFALLILLLDLMIRTFYYKSISS